MRACTRLNIEKAEIIGGDIMAEFRQTNRRLRCLAPVERYRRRSKKEYYRHGEPPRPEILRPFNRSDEERDNSQRGEMSFFTFRFRSKLHRIFRYRSD